MRSRLFLAMPLLLLLAPASLRAQAVAPPPTITAESAVAERARAKAIRDAAERRYLADKADCNTRMIAIGCLTAAQERRAAAGREAEAIRKESHRVASGAAATGEDEAPERPQRCREEDDERRVRQVATSALAVAVSV